MKKEFIGISKKFSFGQWTAYVRIFDNQEKATKWLFTEEYDFRERELFENEHKAIRFYGKGGKKSN